MAHTFQDFCIDRVAHNCRPNILIDAHSLAPYVELTILGGDGEIIKVSNEACSGCHPEHSAVIRSMEYGSTNALTVNLVIHDVAGGTFDSMVRGMNTDPDSIDADYNMKVKWGWVGEKCGQRFVPKASQEVTFFVNSLTSSFDQGKLVYEIEGKDMWKQMMQSRAYKTEGDDGEPLEVRQAIKKMFAHEPQPTIAEKNVRFLRRLSNGEVQKDDFEIRIKEGEKGKDVEGKWEPKNKSKIAAALDWIKPFVTDAGKGFSDFTWDVNSKGEPGVIFWEDNTSAGENCDCTQLGYFVVNGGNKELGSEGQQKGTSNVISFQPKFAWNHTHLGLSGGSLGTGTTNAVATDNKEMENSRKLGHKGQGIQISGDNPGKETSERNNGTDKFGANRSTRNSIEHSFSNTPNFKPVEAELVIQGDPTMIATEKMFKQWVSIIVINPFHLTGGNNHGTSCPDWTLTPPCNAMMTNKGWFVEGINHTIRDGSYTTTLKVKLSGPGGNKPTGTQMGCAGPTIN